MNKYDFLIVGSGLFGSTCAYELSKKGYKVLVIEKRDHLGGNVYTKAIHGINVHMYGAHIFHTDRLEIWNYVNRFDCFNNFVNSPLANYHGKMFHLPFNMNTFCELWADVKTPAEAKARIEKEIQEYHFTKPTNLKEQAISLVGYTVFNTLIKEYTEKQWGKSCEELPPFIIQRIPVRFTFDNNYFDDPYQGIPINGYTAIIEKMLEGIDTRLNIDFIKHRDCYSKIAKNIIFTGKIDEFFNYKFGCLEYRSLKFEIEEYKMQSYQGNAVINYTSHEQPYTRIIEHKFFEFGKQEMTIISKEYPINYTEGAIPYYPINDDKNEKLYRLYEEESKKCRNVFFGGRLGSYHYFDMDDTIYEALKLVENF